MLTHDDIRAIPLFASLAPAELEHLAQTAADLHLRAGETAVAEGAERALFAVLEGKLEVVKLVDGVERRLGFRATGAIFGEVPMTLGTVFPAAYRAVIASRVPPGGLFARGLVTDLANPQTVLFFASIFAVTLTPTTPAWAKALSWLGIVVVSAAWRCMLSVAFSRRRVRALYARSQRAIERAAGAAFAVFGMRLIADGISTT